MKMDKTKKSQWFYKYEPTMETISLPKRYEKEFTKYISNKEQLPNLLFYSEGPGVGKSSLLNILANEMNLEVCESNVSGDNSINVLKNKLKTFNRKGTIKDGKIIILEEVGKMNSAYQEALKEFIDTELRNTCIAMTTNTIDTLIPSLQDRFFIYNFDHTSSDINYMKPKIMDYLTNILKSENVKYKDENVEVIIDKCFPTIRSMVNALQRTYLELGNLEGNIIYDMDSKFFAENIVEGNYGKIVEMAYTSNINFSEIYKYLRVNFLNEKANLTADQYDDLVELIEDSQRYHSVPDIELHMLHLFVNLRKKKIFEKIYI